MWATPCRSFPQPVSLRVARCHHMESPGPARGPLATQQSVVDRPRGMHGTGMGVEPFDSERLDEWTSTRSGDEDRVWRLQRPRQWGEAREHPKEGMLSP